MDRGLMTIIETQLLQAVSASTSVIYYDELPNYDLLKQFTIIYSIKNGDNELTFEKTDAIKRYSLMVQLNNPQRQPIVKNSVFILNKVLNLPNVYSRISIAKTDTEELFYDSENKCFTGYFRFNLEVS